MLFFIKAKKAKNLYQQTKEKSKPQNTTSNRKEEKVKQREKNKNIPRKGAQRRRRKKQIYIDHTKSAFFCKISFRIYLNLSRLWERIPNCGNELQTLGLANCNQSVGRNSMNGNCGNELQNVGTYCKSWKRITLNLWERITHCGNRLQIMGTECKHCGN